MEAPSPSDRTSLATVLDALGTSLLNVLSAPSGLEVNLGTPVIHDEAEGISEEADGILLLVGAQAMSATTLDAVRAAGSKGYAAVVLKLRQQDPRRAIDASQDAGIALLACPDEVPWRRLDGLLTAAIGVGTEEPGGSAPANDLFSLANALAGVLGGAVAIEDGARNVIAYSTLSGQRIDDVRRQGILARRIPELAKHDEQYRALAATDGVVRFPYDRTVEELPRAAVAVRASNEVLGSIWVIEDQRPLLADGDAVLEEASKVVALTFLRDRIAADRDRHARGESLRGLLDQRIPATSAAETLGLRGAPFALLGFASDDPTSTGQAAGAARLADEVIHTLSAFRSDIATVVIGRTVYAILPSVDDDRSAMRFARDAAQHAEAVLRRPIHGAVARLSEDPGIAALLRDEIEDVLRILSSDRSPTAVATANDVYNRIVLARLVESLGRYAEALHPSIEALRRSDCDRGTAYAETLLAYFEAMGDVAVSAAEIGVHPNTLRHRLRRVRELFGLDLDDPDERLLAWMQLRLLVDTPAPTRMPGSVTGERSEPREARTRRSRATAY